MEKGQQLRVAVLSATLGTLDASGLGRDEALARIDHNTGNLAFQHAVGLHVAGPVDLVDWIDPPDEVRERFDVIVIPEANLKDLEEIGPEVRAKLRFHPVKHVEEVFELALTKWKCPEKQPSQTARSSRTPTRSTKVPQRRRKGEKAR